VEAPAVTSTPSRPPATEKPASPPEPLNETAAVRAALAKYANAYTDLDAAAVRAVWPSVDQAGLTRAFSALDAQQVTFDRCDVQVTGAAGRATCAGTTMWRPKIGGGGAREQNRTWNFVLKNAGGSWQIVKAEVR
jgi:ketosteroid isomerase-like protein